MFIDKKNHLDPFDSFLSAPLFVLQRLNCEPNLKRLYKFVHNDVFSLEFSLLPKLEWTVEQVQNSVLLCIMT